MAIVMDPFYESLKTMSVCPVCGKEYVQMPQHMWKIGNWDGITGERNIRVCSYSCMRKWEKEQMENEKKKKHNRSSRYESKY